MNPPTLGTDTLTPDGVTGVFTAGTAEGTGQITARAGAVDATPLDVNVVDNVIVRGVIVPQ